MQHARNHDTNEINRFSICFTVFFKQIQELSQKRAGE